jgi:hypothetical protein
MPPSASSNKSIRTSLAENMDPVLSQQLAEAGLGEYCGMLSDAGMTEWADLAGASAADLKAIGVAKLFHRNKLIRVGCANIAIEAPARSSPRSGLLTTGNACPALSRPGLALNGRPCPLPPDAETAAFMETAGRLSDFGDGDRRPVDRSVRSSLQFATAEFTDPHWDAEVQRAAREASAALGVVGPVRAAFDKLLVYPPGARFAAHVDRPKGVGWFGTMVVALPSRFAGGDLLCCDRRVGEGAAWRHTYGEPAARPVCAHYVAVRAGVQHEVLAVTEGHRVAATFALLRGVVPSPSADGTPDEPPTARYANGKKD